nr:hypothetical protein [Tanacetum cinerariifolium]
MHYLCDLQGIRDHKKYMADLKYQFREVPKELVEEPLDHSKKLKGIETLFAVTQLMLDMKTATKASKLDHIIQQHPNGSSEGSIIILEIPNEPKDISSSSSSSLSAFDDEVKDITPTPPTTEAYVTNVSESDLSSKVVQRLLNFEKKVEVLSKIDHVEAIEESVQANIFNENLDLYNALIGSIGLDKAIAKGEIDPTKVIQKRRHDDKDKDPSANFEKGKKKRRQKVSKPSKHKDTIRSSKDQLDWANPEGDKFSCDMKKPLPLQGPSGHLTILIDFFFNNDLEYLKTGNQERKYATTLTKTKVQGVEIVDLVNALCTFTRGVIIQRRVEDVQLRVESYQKKLNITRPLTTCDGISFKEPSTIVYDPRVVVYLNKQPEKTNAG